MSERIELIIDSDCGVDDAVALWYALTNPQFDVALVCSVHGNVGEPAVARNLARVLGAADRLDVPLALGAAEALAGSPIPERASYVHGNDGLGNAGLPDFDIEPHLLPADQAIVDLCRRNPGRYTLAALGPATNVARALRLEPGLPGLFKEFIYMGGTFNLPGNVSPVASFNVAGDPLAAKEMVNADWPSPPRMLTFDVMKATTFGESEISLLGEGRTPAARFLREPLTHYHSVTAKANAGGRMACPDMLTMVWLADRGAVDSGLYPLDVDAGRDAAWGMTVVDLRSQALLDDAMRRSVDPAVTPSAIWEISRSADDGLFRAAFASMLGG
jgi:inosine-uridine nucleoside N-ribohydrolase